MRESNGSNPKVNRYHIIDTDGVDMLVDGTHHEIRGKWLYVYLGKSVMGQFKVVGGMVREWWVEGGQYENRN